MVFKGLFYFNEMRFKTFRTSTKSDTRKIIFSSGYLEVDQKWYKNFASKIWLLNTKKGSNLAFDLSKSLGSRDNLESEVSFSGDSNFFYDRIKHRESLISWSIWYDEDNQKLSLSRDAFGTFPLYYIFIPNQFVAFASDIPSLLSIQEVQNNSGGLSNSQISNYLDGIFISKSRSYNSGTIYKNIKSVLPGCIFQFTKEKCQSTLWNEYKPEKWSSLKTVSEFGELFRNLLSSSVSRHVGNTQVLGSHLSGGLDSSSISALLSQVVPQKTLHTFFAETGTKQTSEGNYALEVVNKIRSLHHSVTPSFKELDAVILNTTLYGQPDQMVASPALQHDIFRQAELQNCQQLFTGLDGDGITGYGLKYINELLDDSKWHQVRQVLDASTDFQYILGEGAEQQISKKRKQIYLKYLYRFFLKNLKQHAFQNCFKIVEASFVNFGISPIHFAQKGSRAIFRKLFPDSGTLKNKSLESSLDNDSFETIISSFPSTVFNQNKAYYSDILFDSTIRMTEELFIVGQSFNVDVRHPFYDPELYELSLAVPQEIKYGNGLLRAHLREAMKGLLPENVRMRSDKAIFDFYYKKSSLSLYVQSRDFLTDKSPVWEYVNKQKFNSLIKLLKSDNASGLSNTIVKINQTIFLAVFLDIHSRNTFVK